MSLTKEECLFALESLKPANIYEFKEKGYLSFIEANSILTQLIEEHFEIIKEKERLEKALDKACELLEKNEVGTTCDEENHNNCMENHCFKTCIYARNMTKEELKEWCLKDVD